MGTLILSLTVIQIWKKTNEIYDGIPAYIEHFTADERDMTKYIIGTISDMDVPMNPSTKGDRSMALIYRIFRTKRSRKNVIR